MSSDKPPELRLAAIPDIPLIQAGDALGPILEAALRAADLALQPADVLVVTSKVVSKAEGRVVRLADVEPDARAVELAAQTGKDARIVSLVLAESQSVSRTAPGVLITRHRLGFVSANGGIDQSNLEDGDTRALLLPLDPDASAEALRAYLSAAFGVPVGIVISDSHGRPFRMGNVGVAIGAAGLPALVDMRGQSDLFGRPLRITIQGYADEIASAANLLSGEADEGLPAVLIRGLTRAGTGRAADLVRPSEQDLYAGARS